MSFNYIESPLHSTHFDRQEKVLDAVIILYGSMFLLFDVVSPTTEPAVPIAYHLIGFPTI